MKKNYLLTLTLLGAAAITAAAHEVDFDRIECWTGTGECRSALVVQFNTEYDSHGYVFGYRWDATDDVNGEKMMRDICRDSRILCILTQFTGQYGSTLCGVGLSEGHNVLRTLTFNFGEAAKDPNITFDYYNPSSFMGQTTAPGDDTQRLCADAIDDAAGTHVIQHPVDARTYGYPAYDYDWWQPDESSPYYNESDLWAAGWYKGYWSYWTGSMDSDDLTYSGVGFTGRTLYDGSIDGWSYVRDMDDPEGTPIGTDLIYVSADMSAITAVTAASGLPDGTDLWYTADGIRLSAAPTRPGLYIHITADGTSKTLIR